MLIIANLPNPKSVPRTIGREKRLLFPALLLDDCEANHKCPDSIIMIDNCISILLGQSSFTTQDGGERGIMQAQAQIEKGMLLGKAHLKYPPYTIKEVAPFGVVVEANGVGNFTGVYNATENETCTMFLRMDGTFDWRLKVIQSTNEGDLIAGIGQGTGKVTGPKLQKGEGEVLTMTQSPRLSWLNNKKWRFEYTLDASTTEYDEKFFAL